MLTFIDYRFKANLGGWSINLTYTANNGQKDKHTTTHIPVWSSNWKHCFLAHLNVDYVILGSSQMEVDKVHYSGDVCQVNLYQARLG